MEDQKIQFDGYEFKYIGHRLGQLIKLNSREYVRIVAYDTTNGYWLAEKTRHPEGELGYVVLTEAFAEKRRVAKE